MCDFTFSIYIHVYKISRIIVQLYCIFFLVYALVCYQLNVEHVEEKLLIGICLILADLMNTSNNNNCGHK